MLRQSLTRTSFRFWETDSLRASSPHAPFGGYRSWIVTNQGLAKEYARASHGSLLWWFKLESFNFFGSPVPSPYQSLSLPLPLPWPKVNTNFSISVKCWLSEPTCPRRSDIKDSPRKKLHFVLQFPNIWTLGRNRLCSSVSNKANGSYVMPFSSGPE